MIKIGMLIIVACVICVYAVTADAATKKRAVAKIGNFVGNTCDSAANLLWQNKGAITLGTVLVTAAANPEPYVRGATTVVAGTGQTVVTSYIGSILSCLIIAVVVIAVGRYLFRRIRLWRMLPLVVFGLFLCCGIAEAGMIGVVPETQFGIVKPPWWGVFDLVILIVMLFL